MHMLPQELSLQQAQRQAALDRWAVWALLAMVLLQFNDVIVHDGEIDMEGAYSWHPLSAIAVAAAIVARIWVLLTSMTICSMHDNNESDFEVDQLTGTLYTR